MLSLRTDSGRMCHESHCSSSSRAFPQHSRGGSGNVARDHVVTGS